MEVPIVFSKINNYLPNFKSFLALSSPAGSVRQHLHLHLPESRGQGSARGLGPPPRHCGRHPHVRLTGVSGQTHWSDVGVGGEVNGIL